MAKRYDGRAWAQAMRPTAGRKCSVCVNSEMARVLREACTAWADGTAEHVSWPKLAAGLRDMFGTRTAWESVRNHVLKHEPDLAKALRGIAH